MKNNNNYVGKWCLWKEFTDIEYQSVYVIAIGGGVVRYVTEHQPERIRYTRETNLEFPNTVSFFVNPVPPDFIPDTSAPSVGNGRETATNAANRRCDIEEDCDHEWSPCEFKSFPRVEGRRCGKCGLTQYRSSNGEWMVVV